MTPRQKEIYSWIDSEISRKQRSPTVREIGEHFHITSPNGVVCHVKALERKGFITVRPGARGITLTKKDHAIELRAIRNEIAAMAIELVEAADGDDDQFNTAFNRLTAVVKRYREPVGSSP